METLDALATAALRRDNLQLRSLVQDLIRSTPNLTALNPPRTADSRSLAAAASLVELLCERQSQAPPSWTASIAGLAEPFYLVASALKMKHLRELCDRESPPALRKRGFLAPPNFLEFA